MNIMGEIKSRIFVPSEEAMTLNQMLLNGYRNVIKSYRYKKFSVKRFQECMDAYFTDEYLSKMGSRRFLDNITGEERYVQPTVSRDPITRYQRNTYRVCMEGHSSIYFDNNPEIDGYWKENILKKIDLEDEIYRYKYALMLRSVEDIIIGLNNRVIAIRAEARELIDLLPVPDFNVTEKIGTYIPGNLTHAYPLLYQKLYEENEV